MLAARSSVTQRSARADSRDAVRSRARATAAGAREAAALFQPRLRRAVQPQLRARRGAVMIAAAAGTQLAAAPSESVRAGRSSAATHVPCMHRRREPPALPLRLAPNAAAGAALLFNAAAQRAGLTRRRRRAQRPVALGINVAIVGAGVAGLQQARALQKRGISFTIYEAADDIGGVWRSNYDGYAAQGVFACMC